jgi:hypothetical protein
MDKLKALADRHATRLKILEKNDGKTFHQLHAAKEREEGYGIHDKECGNAQRWGDSNYDSFMAKVKNHNDPQHQQSLKKFLEDFGGSEDTARDRFRKEAASLLGAVPLERQNLAYENNAFKDYRISTSMDQAFMNKFKDHMKTKWAAEGYKGDAQEAADFWEVHPLSTPLPNTKYKP